MALIGTTSKHRQDGFDLSVHHCLINDNEDGTDFEPMKMAHELIGNPFKFLGEQLIGELS